MECATTNFFLYGIARESCQRVASTPPSYFVSLVSADALCKISLVPLPVQKLITVVRHRLERIIAGRSFVIEVTWLAEKRWRAHIVRIPGVPTAMMPFYGETPDEAATHLSDWLDRAHQHQANTV